MTAVNRPGIVRDLVMIALLLAAGVFVYTRKVEKLGGGQKAELTSMVPESFEGWRGTTYDTSGYADQWQSINNLLVRRYVNTGPVSLSRIAEAVTFVLEYSSDLRQNFSFHFPENCHRAGGNEIQFLKPLQVDLGEGKVLKARVLFIKGRPTSIEKVDKVVAYWVAMDGKQHHKMFYIKLDQMLAGLLSKARQGYLVRVDFSEGFEYSPEGIDRASAVLSRFLKDLHFSLKRPDRERIFGRDLA